MPINPHRVTPFLWFDGQAEEAARFYVSVFKKGSKVTSVSPMAVSFELEGPPLSAWNGCPSSSNDTDIGDALVTFEPFLNTET